MMNIVDWLRYAASEHNTYRCDEAADEIERLRNVLQKISKSDTCGCQMECVDMCRIAEAALKVGEWKKVATE